MKVFRFAFNPFQVNTYVVSNEQGSALVIDPGMYNDEEKKTFDELLLKEELKPEAILLTHGHVDHTLGVSYLRQKYGLKVWAHKDTMAFLEDAVEHARVYGLDIEAPGIIDRLVEGDEELVIEGLKLKALLCPGHADGSLCLHFTEDAQLFAGDVLFNGSIGRTDLPTGDMDTLLRSIREKLLVLDPETRVHCGHGPETSIGFEAQTNPFLQ